MRNRIVLVSLAFASTIAFAQGPVNIPRNIKIQLVTKGYSFTEGPSVDGKGNIYFTDCGNHRIMKVTPEGDVSEFANTGGRPNGTKWSAKGEMIAADVEKKAIVEISEDGKQITILSDQCNGEPYRSTNDLAVDANGNIYFTDPGESSLTNPIGAVYYLPAGGKAVRVAKGLAFPNGIAISPDGRSLFVAESLKNRVLRYEMRRGGALARMTEYIKFSEKGQPDGLCFDEDGILYVAHFGAGFVRVVAPRMETLGFVSGQIGNRAPSMAREGEQVADISVGLANVTNLAFGGRGLRTLYITASNAENDPSGLFKVDLPVRGMKLPPRK